ncbi:MAG: thiamine pyrophosphate-dependent dehydrogenase E1 component subunit alpha [Chloroflexota bacterium]
MVHATVRIPEERSLTGYEPTLLRVMYQRMRLIREFELRANRLFREGKIPGTIHLSHGQEAVVVGTCATLEAHDFITLTHRGHGQALAKGVNSRTLMAELFGKATGCCRGKGGSLHVGDVSVGALPGIAIVGASVPIAVGMAFAFKRQKLTRVVVCFHGDGATNEGDWHEALNLAAVWQLPVVFVCENNFYGVTTRFDEASRATDIAQRAQAYGLSSQAVYGNDPLIVYEAVLAAVNRARESHTPSFIECLTYRQGGHKRDDPGTYRPRDEVARWLARDPVERFKDRLVSSNIISSEDMEFLHQSILIELDEAESFAQGSALPPVEWALEDIYA